MCLEPLWGLDVEDALAALLDAGVAESDALASHGHLVALCTERIQHFISRLEQVSAMI